MSIYPRVLVKANRSWTWRDHVCWELQWSAVELAEVLIGLYLLLVAAPVWSGLGTVVLLAVPPMSFIMRLWHYGGVAHDELPSYCARR